ncbi:MAG TPA: EAL domain-containing protein [Pseudoxanthomonas sp.]|nr:EAL domain-containing protein [Pseudoxanthomonas sp.]
MLAVGLLGWRENQLRREQAISRAELVAEAIARQVSDRLEMLAQALAVAATEAELDAEGHSASDAASLRPAALSEPIVVRSLDLEEGAPASSPAGGLRLPPPEPGTPRLPVEWYGTPGIVVRASVDSAWFTELLRGRSVEPDSVISLIHDSRRIYASSRDRTQRQAEALFDSPPFSGGHAARAQEDHYYVTQLVDGIETQRVHQRVPGAPLAVVVETPLAATAAPAWALFVIAAIIALLPGLLWKGLPRAARGRLMQRAQQHATESAEAHERLHQAERQYRALFQCNPLPMWVFDRNTLRFLAANEAMYEHYGYSVEDLRQATVLDICPEADREQVENEARQSPDLRSQGQVRTHLRKDGSCARMAIFTRDIEFDGRTACLVTAQHVPEPEADAQRFRLIARATADAVWDWDAARGTLWWSDNFYSTFGDTCDQGALTLEGWKARLHPEDRDAVRASLAAALADPEVEEWEQNYRFAHRDGHYLHVVDRGFVVRDHGVATRMVGGMRDVSDRREVDERMRLLSRAVEATADGLLIADARLPDYPIVYVNRAFEQITGYQASECIGRNCRFLQGADTDQIGLEGIRYALQEKREARVLLRSYRKDGRMFWNECYVGPVFDESGEVTHFIGTQTDVSQHQDYQRELAHRASHDQLTGMPNRQLIQDRLRAVLLQAERSGGDVAVVFIDLDDFKLVNDSLDHSAGDEALRVVASRLRALVRDGDLAGRFGGDEFVMVLSQHASESEVLALIDDIAMAFAKPIQVAGLEHVLTMSIGWCRYPEAGVDADTLLKHADIAMYEAKRQGRNRALCYTPGLDATVSKRLQLIGQLREALDHKQFVLAFQPIYTRGGELTALECLARWQHPQRGLLPPDEFITACEESGLIMELGRRTLHEAARHHALLVAVGLGHVRLSVNVSALQFGHALEEDVADVVRTYALPRGALELELTESVIMENADRAIDTMRRISDLGVYLAIDDFGTGYSSLAYLKRLPIDRLKIDRSFVTDLPGDRDAASICGSIIGLAHLLGLRTVGEGIETEAQRRWLGTQGCDEMQGYLLAPPALFEEIVEQVKQAPMEARADAHG